MFSEKVVLILNEYWIKSCQIASMQKKTHPKQKDHTDTAIMAFSEFHCVVIISAKMKTKPLISQSFMLP